MTAKLVQEQADPDLLFRIPYAARKLHLACAKETTRYAIGGVYLDKTGWAVATDGRILCGYLLEVFPLAAEVPNGGVIVDVAQWPKLFSRKDTSVSVYKHAHEGSSGFSAGVGSVLTRQLLQTVEGNFPSWRAPVPNPDNGSTKPNESVGFSPVLLAKALTAISFESIDNDSLDFVMEHKNEPALFVGGSRFAVVMPVKECGGLGCAEFYKKHFAPKETTNVNKAKK